jgi:hypothetical protein
MGVAEGFAYSVSKAGTVTLTHHGRPAGTLRGKTAATFLAFAGVLDEDSEALQQRMAASLVIIRGATSGTRTEDSHANGNSTVQRTCRSRGRRHPAHR